MVTYFNLTNGLRYILLIGVIDYEIRRLGYKNYARKYNLFIKRYSLQPLYRNIGGQDLYTKPKYVN